MRLSSAVCHGGYSGFSCRLCEGGAPLINRVHQPLCFARNCVLPTQKGSACFLVNIRLKKQISYQTSLLDTLKAHVHRIKHRSHLPKSWSYMESCQHDKCLDDSPPAALNQAAPSRALRAAHGSARSALLHAHGDGHPRPVGEAGEALHGRRKPGGD